MRVVADSFHTARLEARKPPPPPDALVPALRALEDAHQHWHDAADAYHDPGLFRRRLEALVQALRNVTWRLQSAKADLPGFDDWYPLWQEYLRADARLLWLNDARIEVVKKAGLRSQSHAVVRVIDSYLEPRTVVLELPADTPTAAVVERARAQILEGARPHVAIEVARRWSVPAFPGEELLTVLAHCWHVLDALLIFASERASGPVGEAPDAFVRTVLRPSCMWADPSLRVLAFEADTGDEFRTVFDRRTPDWGTVEEEAKRRGLHHRLLPGDDASLEAHAEWAHELARRIFRKDGYHLPIVFLRRPDGEWETFVTWVEDKRDKFVQWHHLGSVVRTGGHDALIFTTETWQAALPNEPTPYPDVAGMPGRRELLVTYAAGRDGTAAGWASEIFRMLGRPYLKKPVHTAGLSPDAMMFASPVRRAWAVRRAEDDGKGATRLPHLRDAHDGTVDGADDVGG